MEVSDEETADGASVPPSHQCQQVCVAALAYKLPCRLLPQAGAMFTTGCYRQ